MSLHLQRYLDASQFTRELEPLRAYRKDYVGQRLLEALEAAHLVIPRVRVRLPDPVARRFWGQNREPARQFIHPVEPDGPRWNAAVEFGNAIHHWKHPTVYGPCLHPLDNPDPRFTEFIRNPATTAFESWDSMRVDVSNDVEATLFDSRNVDSYYSSWQLLLAAEAADAGIHFRINLADQTIAREAHEALDYGKAPDGPASFNLLPVHAMRGFAKHEKALDAVVRYAEECGRALAVILKGQGGGRFRLTEAQAAAEWQATGDAAEEAARHHTVTVDDLIALCRFLAVRWKEWDHNGRPLIASAYKDFLGEAVQMTKRLGELPFLEVRNRVGRVGGWHYILDKIWPDWAEEEKDRVRLTLKSSLTSRTHGGLDAADIDAFVDFLAEEGHEAFFWRLRSFEDHAFRGNQFSIAGMKSDIQGMALAVEHVAAVLGSTETQLYEKFKQLWHDPDVLAILKRGDVSPLARQERLAHNWPDLKVRIEALRAEKGGNVAADLVMAHRIRGGVHNFLPEDDQFELEALFVILMRAAALTFSHVRPKTNGKP